MAGTRSPAGAESEAERRVWSALTANFRSALPPELSLSVHGSTAERPRFQVFEVIVAAIFARLRPEYEWSVSPNGADGGLDFVGKHSFVAYEALGIDAAITVGGQCKKRTQIKSVVDVLAGSLVNMGYTLAPTFFVVALSARVDPARVEEARKRLERELKRDCHILDRPQIEALIRDHLAVVGDVLREADFVADELREVLTYFESQDRSLSPDAVSVFVPRPVQAGIPFRIGVSVRSSSVSLPGTRLQWVHRNTPDGDADGLIFIGPLGGDLEGGIQLASDPEDPLRCNFAIELVTYAVGDVNLGDLLISVGARSARPHRVQLGATRVIDNVRPRFFFEPFKDGYHRLEGQYERVLAGAVASVGVVGSGGSGKSRLCEEFSLEQRQRGARVVVARQAKTLDDPYRILAELFVDLVDDSDRGADRAERVVQAIDRYDCDLSATAKPSIRSIFGCDGRMASAVSERSVQAALALLILARAQRGPLIVHLQDLHWCTADILMLLEGLVWELDQMTRERMAAPRPNGSGILFLFEGRVRERQAPRDGWTSEPFEAFLQKLGCPTVVCAPFGLRDRLKFIELLFETRDSARGRVSHDLLELQRELVERINETAGGSPFHSLEQVKLLKERRVIGQNPATGFLYLIQPDLTDSSLPDSVFESIRQRWNYLRSQASDLALLVWAAALLEDRVPMELFRRLRQELAPDVAARDIDATEMVWTGDGREGQVTFRHENYFRSVRLFEVAADERQRVVEIYCDFYATTKNDDPADRFRWARALLELPQPDVSQAIRLLRSALRRARGRGELPLARRVSATSLDLAWKSDGQRPLSVAMFLRRCDDELEFVRDLLGSDRLQADRRLDALCARLDRRLASGRAQGVRTVRALQRRTLTAQVLRTQVLFNDQEPARACDVAAQVVKQIRAVAPRDGSDDVPAWQMLEMEALHSHAVGLALAGEIGEARTASEQAVAIARRSPSPLGQHVVNTYANILLGTDPVRSEAILRESLDGLDDESPTELRHEAEINLSMTLLLRAHQLGGDDERREEMLAEADRRLRAVFETCRGLGQHPDAAAAALLLGVVCASRSQGDEVAWFAQAVAAAARGRQMETLWRAHVNTATAMYGRRGEVDESVRDHARAALELLEKSLSSYAEPDRSPRFRLVASPLAQAVGFLVKAGDPAGVATLERHPGLRAPFADVSAGILRENATSVVKHEWLRVGRVNYVLY